MNVDHYRDCFIRLNCARYRGREAPHKPVLLLALIELFEQGRLKGERILPDEILEHAFIRNWERYVTDSDFKMLLGTPFYHMRNERFWVLEIDENQGIELEDKNKLKQLNTLRRVGAQAYLDAGLVVCLQDRDARQILRDALLERYFYQKNTQDQHGSNILRFPRPAADPACLQEREGSFELKLAA